MNCPFCGVPGPFKRYGFTPQGTGRRSCLACHRIHLDPTMQRVVKVQLPVGHDATSLDMALAFVREGIWRIDDEGAIWKEAELDRWGHRRAVAARRVDRLAASGHRVCFFWLHGKSRGVTAAQLIWTHAFGPVPANHRVSRLFANRQAPDQLALSAYGGRQPAAKAARVSECWPFVERSQQVDPLVAAINALVPRDFFEEHRREVCQEVALRVLADGAELNEALVKECASRARRNYPVTSGFEYSLDSVIKGTDSLRRIDLLASDAVHV